MVRPVPMYHQSFESIVFLVLCILIIVPSSAFANYINSLTYEQLPSLLATSPALLIFTARWCEHSAALAPEIKALASAARDTELITVARVDADDEPALPAKFEVNAYPTLLYFERSFPLSDKSRRPIEFGDYRWAEVIAEFVNNRSENQVLHVPPRQAFLRWREKNPYNIGEQAHQTKKQESSEGSFDDLGVTLIREPLALTADNFDHEIFEKSHNRVLALFYTPDDPLVKDLLLHWRQASSAFTGADNVTVALVDLSANGNTALRERYDIDDTPHCLYFPRCDEQGEEKAECRSPHQCSGELDNTENIIQYLSDRVMEELGLTPDEEEGEVSSSYTLTEEQYQKMKEDGVVFANDVDHQDQMRSIYEQHASRSTHQNNPKEDL